VTTNIRNNKNPGKIKETITTYAVFFAPWKFKFMIIGMSIIIIIIIITAVKRRITDSFIFPIEQHLILWK